MHISVHIYWLHFCKCICISLSLCTDSIYSNTHIHTHGQSDSGDPLEAIDLKVALCKQLTD